MQANLYYDVRLLQVLPEKSLLEVQWQNNTLSLPVTPAHAQAILAQLSHLPNPHPRGLAKLITQRPPETPEIQRTYEFIVYPDQSLTRAYELDLFEYNEQGYNTNCIGWRTASNPHGFLAGRGIIPGEQGNFVFDGTEPCQIMIPPEFTALCVRLHCSPEALLRRMVADAAGLKNLPEAPRADGYHSPHEKAQNLMLAYIRELEAEP